MRSAVLRTVRFLPGSVCLAAAIAAAPSYAAVLNPIGTTGHNEDIIVELGATSGATVTTGELGSRQFYEDGLQASQPTNPMPGLTQNISGFTSTVTGNTINYAFQPFAENNILKFDTVQSSTKSLSIVMPAMYTQLAVVLSGGSLASGETALLDYTINYAGGETQMGTLSLPDWGNVPVPAGTEVLVNAGRINMGVPGTWNNQIPEGNTTPNRWSVYVTEITPTRSDLNILSIDFGPVSLNSPGTPLNASDDVVVFGLAGALVPEPSSFALCGFGILALIGWRRTRGNR